MECRTLCFLAVQSLWKPLKVQHRECTMNPNNDVLTHGQNAENAIAHLSLIELCRISHAEEKRIIAWVSQGVLEPTGHSPDNWLFSNDAIRRIRLADWLTTEMDVNLPGAAMILNLLDEIAELQSRMQHIE